MANENEFLLHALIMGIFITFVYDILRIFRRVVPHNSFFVSLEDLGFWIYCGAEVFLLMYHESNGTLRWFAVLGALVGMMLYKKIFSPCFVKYCSLLLNRMMVLIGKIFRFIFRPLGVLCEKTGQGAYTAARSFRQITGRIGRRVKNRLTYFLKLFKMSLKK